MVEIKDLLYIKIKDATKLPTIKNSHIFSVGLYVDMTT